ncbi:Imm40 family immunity protein [Enterococcus faecium]|uniref:Imm40 family immunity protein n=1 Tax=Enterococcus faecium TaxID=1352 RepID=UPI00209124EF|nr:Imm40 family immunity protein [Enterococcus faecium]MCO5533299.1 Imm40 family immunity protein [Enterococcus faecium]
MGEIYKRYVFLPDKLLEKGICLENLGIKELAWDFNYTSELIDILELYNYKILGGDVYKFSKGQIEPTYDNWFFTNEKFNESLKKTRYYINDYHNKHGNEYLFSIIFEFNS